MIKDENRRTTTGNGPAGLGLWTDIPPMLFMMLMNDAVNGFLDINPFP